MNFRIKTLAPSLFLAIFFVTGLAGFQFSDTKEPTIALLAGITPASAQQRRKVKNLFQLLFERKKKRSSRTKRKTTTATKPGRKSTKRTRSRKSRRSTAAASTAAAAGAATAAAATPRSAEKKQPEIPPKSENAHKVLVIGDFIGDRLANGLIERFETDPNIVFIDKAQGNSGLVRDDVYNWPEKVVSLIEELQPKLVVIAIGMNDRQQIKTGNGRANKLSDEWRLEYEKRVSSIISSVLGKKIPLVWVGLPPVRIRSMNADYLLFNEIFRNKSEAAGAKFVDIWDGFTDANGNYVTAGPDVNGQIVRLRLNDGINFTTAGRNKLAYYVERNVRAAIGLGAPIMVTIPQAGSNMATTINPGNAANTGKTALMSLEGGALDGGSQLDGAGTFIQNMDNENNASTSHDLVVKGISTSPQPGRIDAGWGMAKTSPDGEKEETAKPANGE